MGAKPYSYDERGRLIGVAEGLTVLSEYDYDDNGNRLSHTIPGGTVTATYDDQERLLSYGQFEFTYGENGELETKTDTTTSDVTSYVYDARGSLHSVTLPDTTLIEYVIDGQGRRVGKKVDGALAQGFLYKDQLRIAAELDATGEVAAHFSYVGDSHSPDWMTKGGELYRLVKDQVGSVRLVVNALTGDVAQEIEYDEFGVVTSDSNPGFQPFGFAGGLYDGDTGLTRFGARDYDARVGRWTAKDPVRWTGGQTNIYAYVDNDAPNRVDPSGTGPYELLGCLLSGADAGICVHDEVRRICGGPLGAAICSSPDPLCEDSEPPDCESQYAFDLASCRGIGRRDKSRAARCYAAAIERKIACEQGRPLPPLHGWN